MNANEMADLMILFDSGRIYEHAEEIATMLRQQQAEIEALKGLIEVMRIGQPNIDYDKELLKPTFVGRELTQEEILDIWYEMKDSSNDWTRYVEFARAILRKAQEK